MIATPEAAMERVRLTERDTQRRHLDDKLRERREGRADRGAQSQRSHDTGPIPTLQYGNELNKHGQGAPADPCRHKRK